MNLQYCIELAKFAADRHDKRRQYEWKISFAFWALIVGAIFKKAELGEIILPWHGGLLVALYAFVWLRGLHVANENDKRLSDYFRAQAEAYLSNTNHTLQPAPGKISARTLEFWLGFLGKWAMQFHLLVTGLLVYLYFIMDP